MKGYQYPFLYHRPTGRFVPLAKLKTTAPDGICRVDLHPRLSRSARTKSIDATYEGLNCIACFCECQAPGASARRKCLVFPWSLEDDSSRLASSGRHHAPQTRSIAPAALTKIGSSPIAGGMADGGPARQARAPLEFSPADRRADRAGAGGRIDGKDLVAGGVSRPMSGHRQLHGRHAAGRPLERRVRGLRLSLPFERRPPGGRRPNGLSQLQFRQPPGGSQATAGGTGADRSIGIRVSLAEAMGNRRLSPPRASKRPSGQTDCRPPGRDHPDPQRRRVRGRAAAAQDVAPATGDAGPRPRQRLCPRPGSRPEILAQGPRDPVGPRTDVGPIRRTPRRTRSIGLSSRTILTALPWGPT